MTRRFTTVIWVVLGACVLAQTTLSDAAPISDDQHFVLQSSTHADFIGGDFTAVLADIDGDKRADIVAFDGWGVHVVRPGLSPSIFSLKEFGYQSKWRTGKHVRAVGDINGDKRDDIVGFGDAGVYRALSTTYGFGTSTLVVSNFGYDQGWRVENHVRLLADVNGDGQKDIVAFGNNGVWLALASGSGNFSEPSFVLADFGYNQGWRPSEHVRTMADVDGDGREDIVAFGNDGVWLALSTGTGFQAQQFVIANFGYNQGWRLDRHLRYVTDINGDGKADIVAFGNDGVWTALSTGNGFQDAKLALADFGYETGWRVDEHPRFVADINGDGLKDIVGFGHEAVFRALNGPTGFQAPRAVLRALVEDEGYTSYTRQLRLVGDLNGDGRSDLVAIAGSRIDEAFSLSGDPPSPPRAPSDVTFDRVTSASIAIAWHNNANDQRRFFVRYGKQASGGTQKLVTDRFARTLEIGALDPDTVYCFTVEAESIWGVSETSPLVCAKTNG